MPLLPLDRLPIDDIFRAPAPPPPMKAGRRLIAGDGFRLLRMRRLLPYAYRRSRAFFYTPRLRSSAHYVNFR